MPENGHRDKLPVDAGRPVITFVAVPAGGGTRAALRRSVVGQFGKSRERERAVFGGKTTP